MKKPLNVKEALRKLAAAAQELSDVVEEENYEMSDCAPEYISDVEDFAYEITTFVEDEVEHINEVPQETN